MPIRPASGMDAGKVLMAIEEKRRWEERALETERQLGEVRKRKAALNAELKAVGDKAKYYGALADSTREFGIFAASGRLAEGGGRRML